jgi:signal transduction histidine kinase/CheY-like chemotaxis protein/HPt (histidine-containing phosphotransfer) domain-containing protein
LEKFVKLVDEALFSSNDTYAKKGILLLKNKSEDTLSVAKVFGTQEVLGGIYKNICPCGKEIGPSEKRQEFYISFHGEQEKFSNHTVLPYFDERGLRALIVLQEQYRELTPKILSYLSELFTLIFKEAYLERELNLTKALLLEASETKSRFIANMSHEIRTPLNGVLGMAELLLSTNLDIEQRELTDSIVKSGHYLLEIINDLIDFSQLELGEFKITKKSCNIKSLLQQIVTPFQKNVLRKDIEFTLEVDPELPTTIVTDETRVRQVIINLLNNAYKFTEHGAIQVRVKKQQQNENIIKINFEVSDTGIGIEREALSRIFESFSQADASTRKKYGGSGLGLTICKQLVEGLGGEIEIHSEYGKGSIVCFSIYAEISKEQRCDLPNAVHSKIQKMNNLESLSVLVAEDNPVNQQLMKLLLKKLGHNVDIASNGPEAIEAVEYKKYDLILMDLHMPKMDGVEVCNKLREKYSLEDLPAIIAVSASVLREDRENCLAAGMSDFITKPINIDHLKRVLTKYGTRIPDEGGDKQMEVEVVNIEKILFHFDGDEEILDSVILSFKQSYPQMLREIMNAIDSKDFSNIELKSHTLKSSLSLFFASELVELADRLEESGRVGHFRGDEKGIFLKLEKSLENLVNVLGTQIKPNKRGLCGNHSDN